MGEAKKFVRFAHVSSSRDSYPIMIFIVDTREQFLRVFGQAGNKTRCPSILHFFDIRRSPFFSHTLQTPFSVIMRLSSPILSLAFFCSTEAFVPSRPTTSLTALHVGTAIEWNQQNLDENLLLKRAEACADSDTCSLDEARTALNDVLQILSGCVTGTILGSVCENVDVSAGIVARLREKIAVKSKEAM